MFSIVHTLLVLVALVALNELCRRSKWLTLAFFFVLPLILSVTLFPRNATAPGSSVNSWFDWAKVYSVLCACLLFTAINYTKLGERNWAKFLAMGILAVNILEAVIRDMQLFFTGDQIGMFGLGQAPIGQFGIYHLMNAIAGILSIVTLSGWHGMRSEKNKSGTDMIWPDMQLLWIIAYDFWNFAYIYNCVPIHAAFGAMVLLACTIPSLLIKKGTWLQARAYTLAGWMMYVMAVTPFIDAPGHYISLPYAPFALILVSGASLALNGAFAFVHFRKVAAKKRLAFGEEVYGLAFAGAGK